MSSAAHLRTAIRLHPVSHTNAYALCRISDRLDGDSKEGMLSCDYDESPRVRKDDRAVESACARARRRSNARKKSSDAAQKQTGTGGRRERGREVRKADGREKRVGGRVQDDVLVACMVSHPSCLCVCVRVFLSWRERDL